MTHETYRAQRQWRRQTYMCTALHCVTLCYIAAHDDMPLPYITSNAPTDTYAHKHTQVHTRIHTCMHTLNTYQYIDTYMHAFTHMHISTYIHALKYCIEMHKHWQTYIRSSTVQHSASHINYINLHVESPILHALPPAMLSHRFLPHHHSEAAQNLNQLSPKQFCSGTTNLRISPR